VLSTQIKQLETELGFDLYTRPRRAQILQPTTEGHEILSTLEEFSPSCGIRLHEHPN
jgi:DNA-binding transcriptional LysR family regulator